jgi:hypothetical protein
MGIGFHQNFDNTDELCDWIIENLQMILNTKQIPKDINRS